MREVRYIYTNDKGHEIYVIKGNDLKGKYGDEYPVKK